jgi:ABC-type uncharacterized transport system ATPase subunit
MTTITQTSHTRRAEVAVEDRGATIILSLHDSHAGETLSSTAIMLDAREALEIEQQLKAVREARERHLTAVADAQITHIAQGYDEDAELGRMRRVENDLQGAA